MKGSMVILRPGEMPPERKEFDRPVELEEVRTAVGGDLEIIPYFDTIAYAGTVLHCVAFCNEHHKEQKLPVNGGATVAWERSRRRSGVEGLAQEAGLPKDWLGGSVAVIFGDKEFMASL